MPPTPAGRAFYRPTTPARKRAMLKRIRRAPDLTPSGRRLLLEIFGPRYHPRTGGCGAHLVTLAGRIGRKEKQTRRLIRQAERAGFLEYESTGRRRRLARWLPAFYRFRPGERLCCGLEDDPRPGRRRDPRMAEKAISDQDLAVCAGDRNGHADDPPRESYRFPCPPPGERLRPARPDGGGVSRGDAAPAPAPERAADPDTNQGLRSGLELPAEARHFLVDTAPAKRRTKRGEEPTDQLSLAFDGGGAERRRRPPAVVASLSEAAVARFAAEDPGWSGRHPPGSLVRLGGTSYLVPACHPGVPTEEPAALAAIRGHAVRLAQGPASERYAAFDRVRARFPAAERRLVEARYAHELARAAYIVGRLREREAAGAVPPGPAEFMAALVACARHGEAEEARRPAPFRDFAARAAAPACPAERRLSLELGLARLERLAAAVGASPAGLWRLPEEVARWLGPSEPGAAGEAARGGWTAGFGLTEQNG